MSLLFASTTTDRVDFGSPAILDDLHASTFSGWAWVYRTANGTNKHIMTKDSSGPNGWGFVVVNTAAEGGITLVVQRNTTGAQFTSDASNVIPLNTWCLVGFAYDPTGSPQARLYIGTLTTTIAEVSGYSATTAGSGTAKTDAAANLYVGNLQRANTNSFTGRIARIGLSTSLLTVADFRRIQWGSAFTLPPGTVLAAEIWGLGTSNFDLTGAGSNGTVTGTTIADGLPLMMPYAVMAGDPCGGIVSADVAKPVYAGASVATNGLTISATFTDAGTLLPTSGVTGFVPVVAGATITPSSVTASGTTVTITLPSAVYANEVVTLAYVPGNVTDNASNVLDAFAAQSVTNNSTVVQVIAPNHANIVYPVADVVQVGSTYARTTMPGNTLALFGVNSLAGEPITFTMNTTRYATGNTGSTAFTTGTTPTISVFLDGALVNYGVTYVQLTTLANSQTITVAAAPTDGFHLVRIVVRSIEERSGQALSIWDGIGGIPNGAVELTSISLGKTSTMATLTSGTHYGARTILMVGDSQTAGVLANLEQGDSTTTTNAVNGNMLQSWGWLLFYVQLGYEIGFDAKGGIGVSVQSGTYQGSGVVNPGQNGTNGLGAGQPAVKYLYKDVLRTATQTHTLIVNMIGANDAGAITQAMIESMVDLETTLYSATPLIINLVNPLGTSTANSITNRNAQIAATAARLSAGKHVKLIDTLTNLLNASPDVAGWSPDGSHMNHQGQIEWARLVRLAMISAGVITAGGSRNRRGRMSLLGRGRLF